MEQLVGVLLKVLLFAFVVGMFTLVIRVFIRGRKEDARIRRDWSELARVAAERGWTYEPRARDKATRYCGVGPMPGSGSNLSAWHHITGEFRGRDFVCFEHRYNDPMSGNLAADRKRPTIEVVFMVSAPGSGAATEILRPSRVNALLDRRASMRLEISEFDENFRVVTENEAWVRGIMTDDMVSFLLTDPRAKESPLQLRDDELFTWYTGTLSPQALEERLNFLCDVLDRIPLRSWTAT